MLGSAVFKSLSSNPDLLVTGSLRSDYYRKYFPAEQRQSIISGIDVTDTDNLINLLYHAKPDVVINCVGLIKQLDESQQVLTALPINSIFPHRLANLCALSNIRLVHISTDCVFSGKRGNYAESDISDAEDIYGKSKFLGEVINSNAITLRTSIIGHELNTCHSLLDWFLSQKNEVKGFRRSIFSGLPTVEIARVINELILPNTGLNGLFHVSSNPISKFDLLSLIATQYNKEIDIVPDDQLVLDRSLNSMRFKAVTGYQPPSWSELVKRMYEHNAVSAQQKRED